MPQTLEQAKREVSARYIGRSGIHGVGIRRSANAIYVYVDTPGGEIAPGVWSEMTKVAFPYPVVKIGSSAPTFASKISRWFGKGYRRVRCKF